MVTLAEEEPFAAVVEDSYLTNVCSSCFKREDTTLSRCVGCRMLHYCNKQCQKNDWINHKRECGLLKKYSPLIPDYMCRLITRIVLKLEGPDARVPVFNGRRFEDLVDHIVDILNDDKHIMSFNRVWNILKIYMGDELIPDAGVLISIYGKIIVNTSSILMEADLIGTGVYLGMSAHDHSCNPDVFIVYENSKAIMRSPNKNLKYSKDLTIAYIPVLATKTERQEALRSKMYFTCKCSICLDPTEDFLKKCARSTCCPDSYCLLDPNASELKCFKCGTPSEISVQEAIAVNQKTNLFIQKINKEGKKFAADKEAYLKALIRKYEKFSKVLSPFNVHLVHVAYELYQSAARLSNYAVCHKYADSLYAALKLYLNAGSPSFTDRLMCIIVGLARNPKPSRKVMELLEEALAASKISYGPNHPVTSEITLSHNYYRMKFL